MAYKYDNWFYVLKNGEVTPHQPYDSEAIYQTVLAPDLKTAKKEYGFKIKQIKVPRYKCQMKGG